jgi:hypothetical protein
VNPCGTRPISSASALLVWRSVTSSGMIAARNGGVLLREIELRDDAVAITRVDDFQYALCRREVVARDREPRARREQLEVGGGDARGQRQADGLGVEAGDVDELLLRLHAACEPAPQVDLVVHRDRHVGRAAACAVAVRAAAVGRLADRGADRRQQRRVGDV